MPAAVQEEITSTLFPPMSRALTGVRFIVSVFPVEQTHTQPMGYSVPTIKLKAATKDSYVILPIHDTFQRVPDMSNDEIENHPLREAPLTAECLALSMVEKWSNSISVFGQPGIGMLPTTWSTGEPTSLGSSPNEKVDEQHPEFKQFIAKLVAKQRDMANWCIQNANDNFIVGKSDRIGEIHRILAQWQLGEGVKNLKWFTYVGDSNTTKSCMACGKTIEFAALVCGGADGCRTDLIKYCMEYNREGEDAAVDAAIENLNKKRKNVKQPTPVSALESNPVSQPEGAPMPLPIKPTGRVSETLTAKVLAQLSNEDRTKYAALPSDAKKADFVLKVAREFNITEG